MSPEPKRRVLIVEDDPEIQYLLTVILEDEDRELVSAGTGAEAWLVLQEQQVDLVVLDLILPDMDGRTLLTQLRERPETATTPVVVISARSGPEIRQECYSLGADFYTEKPFDPDEVAGDVKARLDRAVPVASPSHLDPRTGLLNRAGLLEIFDRRSGTGALALIQLDEFHAITERWGWDVGAELLREASDILESEARERVLSRLGGGEFAIFSVDGTREELAEVSERMLAKLRSVPFEDPNGEAFNLTASIGVVEVEENAPLDDALDEARRRLFRAKESGRNQVVAEDQPGEGGSARILVAEDDEISATILLHRLEREGLDVVRFDNGKAAFEGALQETPDLVILDVKMPGMDGFEVLERLRRTPAYQKIPIIMLTSMGSEADVVRGFQLGADDYVLKPFSPIELSARVWRLLRRGRSAAAL